MGKTPTKPTSKKAASKSVAAKAHRPRKYSYKKWDSNNADGKLLTRILSSGEVSPGSPPAFILESYPVFKKYKYESFTGAVRRIKKNLGLMVRKTNGKESGKWR